jgi:DNA-binding NtrC family response regulator
MARVLLVDDEPDFASAAVEMLRYHSHEVRTAETLEEARKQLDRSIPEVVLLDLILPDGNGLELLPDLTDRALKKIVLITGHPGIKAQIKHLSGPAISYLTKPLVSDDLVRMLRDVDEGDRFDMAPEPRDTSKLHFGRMVGEHELMYAMYKQIERVGRTGTHVLIVGETGTGKELIAESIHGTSGLEGAFVVVNCGSLPSELAGSELFGHEKGSFTGAIRGRAGFFRRANGGTLFLDELTEMPIELQPHFLRVLETGKILPIGGEKEWTVNARVIAATNRAPESAIADHSFRQDLYFRLSAFPIVVPPLRDRASDIPLLAQSFLDELSGRGGKRYFSERALCQLQAYRWPGNVRELRHVVQRALIMSDPASGEVSLPARFDSPFSSEMQRGGVEAGRSIREVEKELIERTLVYFDGDKKSAAAALGISLNTLYNRLNSYQRSKSA